MKNTDFISKELRLDGNHLCFDFTNTIFDRHIDSEKKLRDLISSAEDWIAWLKKTELLKDDIKLDKDTLFDLDKITQTRESLYRIFSSIQLKKNALKNDLKRFEKLVLKAQLHTKISVTNGKPSQEIIFNKKDLNNYLLPIVKSAYDLFLSEQTDRIKDCSHCGWLYLDTSKNNSRKWCSMDTCGSQLKARRYYKSKKTKN